MDVDADADVYACDSSFPIVYEVSVYPSLRSPSREENHPFSPAKEPYRVPSRYLNQRPLLREQLLI